MHFLRKWIPIIWSWVGTVWSFNQETWFVCIFKCQWSKTPLKENALCVRQVIATAHSAHKITCGHLCCICQKCFINCKLWWNMCHDSHYSDDDCLCNWKWVCSPFWTTYLAPNYFKKLFSIFRLWSYLYPIKGTMTSNVNCMKNTCFFRWGFSAINHYP